MCSYTDSRQAGADEASIEAAKGVCVWTPIAKPRLRAGDVVCVRGESWRFVDSEPALSPLEKGGGDPSI